MMVGLFISIVAIFAAYCVGSNIGYADCIKHQENKKGIQQYSRMPYNQRF